MIVVLNQILLLTYLSFLVTEENNWGDKGMWEALCSGAGIGFLQDWSQVWLTLTTTVHPNVRQ